MAKMISFGKITFVLIGVAFTILLVSLVIPYSVDLRMSSLVRLWIASQFIIFMIWKFSDIEANTNINQLQYLELSLPPATESLENWYHARAHDAPEPESMPPPEVDKEVVITVDVQDSMDDTWKAIVERNRGAGKRVLSKSETWEVHGSAEAEAERAVARRALRKSDTVVIKKEVVAATKKRPEVGWRGRESLVVGHDELFQRVETFINKHYDHLRLQRQESEQQRFLERPQWSS